MQSTSPRALKAQGLDVQGDPAIDYTETHQVIVSVATAPAPRSPERLEENNVIVNYQPRRRKRLHRQRRAAYGRQ